MEFETLKKSHIKRNIIIGVIAVLIISAIVLTFTRARYRVTQSIPLVNGTINYTLPDIQIVGLYINGVEAEELDSTKSYTLDTTQSTCTYRDGTTIDNLTLRYDSSTKAFSISPYTTKGTKCTLYFEEYQPLLIDVVKEAYVNNTTTLAYDEISEEVSNLRYIGANPNNYVWFNGELWRIIGIFSEDTHGVSGTELIKIIRDERIGNYSWDSSKPIYGFNDWSNSALQIVLNEGAYWNRTSGTCLIGSNGQTTNCDFSSTGLTEEAKAMIETVTWKLGGSSSSEDVTASMFYERERGTTVYSGHATEWTGKVGLMYASDYGYATSGGATIDRATCLATELYNWRYNVVSSDCYDNDWLYTDSYLQWTLTSGSSLDCDVFFVHSLGYLSIEMPEFDLGVRPSVYLTSEVSVSGGDGTSTKPYQLQLT